MLCPNATLERNGGFGLQLSGHIASWKGNQVRDPSSLSWHIEVKSREKPMTHAVFSLTGLSATFIYSIQFWAQPREWSTHPPTHNYKPSGQPNLDHSSNDSRLWHVDTSDSSFYFPSSHCFLLTWYTLKCTLFMTYWGVNLLGPKLLSFSSPVQSQHTKCMSAFFLQLIALNASHTLGMILIFILVHRAAKDA